MTTAFNRPIRGEIHRYTDGPSAQADPQELIVAIDSVLNLPGVRAVRWPQYTPYFNDGEACVFGVHGVEVAFEDHVVREGEKDYDDDGFYDVYSLYGFATESDWASRRKTFLNFKGANTEVVYCALNNLEGVLTSGKHDVILSEKFGDPAQVTATKDGFDVEYYDHD